ncbi:MAG: HsmA family protein [Treponema sp.]|nr:HsmA family protein [Treponema sp.]
MLTGAIVIISLAFVFYTTAVWWEKGAGMLRGRHILLFWLGFACDSVGTSLMAKIAGQFFRFDFHGITGLLAIALMLLHALWGTLVHAGKKAEPKLRFHAFSVFVWALWLIPYVSGIIFGMSGGGAGK